MMCLLGVNLIDIQFVWFFKGLMNSVFGDFIEYYVVVMLFIVVDDFLQVSGNGFFFVVKVGCEIDVVSFFC